MSENTQAIAKTGAHHAEQYPLLPLRDVVVLPHMVVPLFVGREKSIRALEAAMELSPALPGAVSILLSLLKKRRIILI